MEEDMKKVLDDYLEKLFSGKYDVCVTAEDGSKLNFSELMRLVVHTLKNVSLKIIELEEMDHSKKPRNNVCD